MRSVSTPTEILTTTAATDDPVEHAGDEHDDETDDDDDGEGNGDQMCLRACAVELTYSPRRCVLALYIADTWMRS